MAKAFVPAFLALSVWCFSGCASKTKEPRLQPAVKIDLNRYMGEWYVIADIPTGLERDAHNAVEKYTWNEEKKRIDIEYRYNKGAFDGTPKSIPQKGFVEDETTNAEWKVQPVWPLKFESVIVDVAPDYSDTIVGVPDRDYVWIMSRKPKMDPARYRRLVRKVRSLGYDVTKLRLVPQEPSAARTRTE